MKVGIYVFDQVEVLDFAGPYEVFTTASRVNRRLHPQSVAGKPLFEVFMVGPDLNEVTARAGLQIHPDQSVSDHVGFDVLVIAGGVVTEELKRNALLSWLVQQAAEVRVLASVCTGALLLGRAGLLDALEATTHWEDLEDLASIAPTCTVRRDVRWVDCDRIVTSAGISAGIDMCLHLVERLAGRPLALATARQMDFEWTENESDEVSRT